LPSTMWQGKHTVGYVLCVAKRSVLFLRTKFQAATIYGPRNSLLFKKKFL